MTTPGKQNPETPPPSAPAPTDEQTEAWRYHALKDDLGCLVAHQIKQGDKVVVTLPAIVPCYRLDDIISAHNASLQPGKEGRELGIPDASADHAQAVLQKILSSLLVTGERLRTQDNRITSNPMFCVQEKKRVYGIAPQWTDDFAWVDPQEYFEVDAGTPGAIQIGVKDHWETVMVAFTEAGCEEYLKRNGHNHHGATRIYVESFDRCLEMIAIRSALLEAHSVSDRGSSPAASVSLENSSSPVSQIVVEEEQGESFRRTGRRIKQ